MKFFEPALEPGCDCVTAATIQSRLTGSKCKDHVNYNTFPGATSDAVALINNQINTQINAFNQFLSTIDCPACSAALTKVACQTAFPQCDNTDAIIPMCQSNCAEHIQTCGASALTGLCDTQFTNPYAALNSTRCFNTTRTTNTTCNYCTSVLNSPSYPNCGPYSGSCSARIMASIAFGLRLSFCL